MHVSIPVMALQSIPDNTESSELPRNGKHAQYRWLSIAGERVFVPLSPPKSECLERVSRIIFSHCWLA
jgi:hypothetical protein